MSALAVRVGLEPRSTEVKGEGNTITFEFLVNSSGINPCRKVGERGMILKFICICSRAYWISNVDQQGDTLSNPPPPPSNTAKKISRDVPFLLFKKKIGMPKGGLNPRG